MADIETKTATEEQVKVEQKTTQEGEHTEEQKEAPVQKKYPTKWDLIDQIKASENNVVVLNIYKVHPEAIWKDVKETYKEFNMKIDKVAKKEGMFNLHFRNHADAISFIRAPIRPILDKKFFIRINDHVHHQQNEGWNQLGASGHTEKHETQKYYKSKAKKNFNKKTSEEGENVENPTEEKTENATTEKPTEEASETQHTQPRTRKISNEAKGPKPTGENKRFIGEANKPQITNSKRVAENKTEVQVEEKKTEEDWNTVKDQKLEKKTVDDAKKKADKVKKEKEAEKKEVTKKVEEVKQVASKKINTDLSDGW
ncbi:hypothetical protein ABPG72_019641 [Tetrahymena utriculariae]